MIKSMYDKHTDLMSHSRFHLILGYKVFIIYCQAYKCQYAYSCNTLPTSTAHVTSMAVPIGDNAPPAHVTSCERA